jgi:hypothetical protein
MRKLLSISVLALATLWLTPGMSSAGTFGYFTAASCWPFNCIGGCGCCDKCSVCLKPFNAFSAPCAICINGPVTIGGFGGLGGDCGGGLPGGCDNGAVGQIPQMNGPFAAPPAANVQAPQYYIPPAPQPMPAGVSRQFNYGPMQIGYYTNAAQQPIAVPYYWNSIGR